MAGIHRKDSFLKNAPIVENTFLDVNTLPELPQSSTDEPYVIGSGYDERPDLLAYELYGSSRLWWVFALRNPDVIVDPIRDFKTGVSIFLPGADSVRNITGGS
jgi:hypothetical protein